MWFDTSSRSREEYPVPLGPNASPNLALKYLSIAFEDWFGYLALEVSQTGDPSNANLIITTDVLRGVPANYLALTDIGPPNSRKLRMVFDKAESWTREVRSHSRT